MLHPELLASLVTLPICDDGADEIYHSSHQDCSCQYSCDDGNVVNTNAGVDVAYEGSMNASVHNDHTKGSANMKETLLSQSDYSGDEIYHNPQDCSCGCSCDDGNVVNTHVSVDVVYKGSMNASVHNDHTKESADMNESNGVNTNVSVDVAYNEGSMNASVHNDHTKGSNHVEIHIEESRDVGTGMNGHMNSRFRIQRNGRRLSKRNDHESGENETSRQSRWGRQSRLDL
jgi:hypothetical protein